MVTATHKDGEIVEARQTIACAIKFHDACKGVAEGSLRCACDCHNPAARTFADFFGWKS